MTEGSTVGAEPSRLQRRLLGALRRGGSQRLRLTPADGVAILLAPALWLLAERSGLTLNLFESGTLLAGGQQLVHGQMLYTKVFAFYGPLAYLEPYSASYVVAAVFGHNDISLLLPDLLLSTASCWLGYRLAFNLSGRRWLSLVAPIAIAAQGSDTARTLPAIAALLALARFERTGARPYLVVSGVAAAVALLWWQDAGASLVLALAVTAAIWVRRSRAAAGRALRTAIPWLVGAAATLLPAAITFAAYGAFTKWLYYCFVFPNTTYTGRSATGYLRSLVASWTNLSLPTLVYRYAFYIVPYPLVVVVALAATGLTIYAGIKGRIVTTAPLTAAALSLYALLQLRVVLASLDESKLEDASGPTIVVAVALAAWFLSAKSRRAFGRAGLLILTSCVLAAVSLALIAVQRQVHDRVDTVATGTTTGTGILSGIPLGGASPPAVSVSTLNSLIAYVRSHAQPSQTIFVAPTQPLLYYLTDRENATGYDYLDPVYTTRTVDERIRAELQRHRPAVIILANNKFQDLSELTGRNLAPLTYAWIARHYRTAARIGPFKVLAPGRTSPSVQG